jgi:maltose O-acetyltransferase
MASKVRRTVLLCGYYLFASRLPSRGVPGGEIFREIRQFFCRRLFASSGDWINVGTNVFIADGRHITIGSGSSLGDGSRAYGVEIGDNVMIGPGCVFHKENHNFDDITRPISKQGLADINLPVIENDAWIGERAIVLPGRRIGKGAIVGSGAVVTKNVNSFDVVGGNPARVIGHRTRGDSS